MTRYKVTAKVSVYITEKEPKDTDFLKTAWRRNVKDGKFQAGTFTIKDITADGDSHVRKAE